MITINKAACDILRQSFNEGILFTLQDFLWMCSFVNHLLINF